MKIGGPRSASACLSPIMFEEPEGAFGAADEPEESAPLSWDPPAAEPDEADERASGERWLRRVARSQGIFFFLTGVWPLLHLRSFLAVTGPKTDLWLVQTVGALLAVVGIGLVLAARRRRVPGEWQFTGLAVSLVLAIIDITFVAQRVILPVYLADAAVELGIVAAWVVAARVRSDRIAD